MRGSTRGNWAIAASISAPRSCASGSSRRNASRAEPSARAAACARRAGSIASHGGPRPSIVASISAGRQAVEQQPAAARADGRQHPPRLVRDDEDQRARRRLLDHLQQRIGAGGIEFVGAIDDGDPPAAEGRRHVEHRQRVAHVLDADFGVEALRLGVPFAPRQGEIGMRQRRELARRRMVGGDEEVAGVLRPPPSSDRDWRARSARSARRASPCRFLRGRRSARRGRADLRDRRRASPLRRRRGRPAASSKRGCGAPGKASLSGGASFAERLIVSPWLRR